MDSFLSLEKKIRLKEMTDEEIIQCIDVPNIMVLSSTIVFLLEKKIKTEHIKKKLIEYSLCMGPQFKLIGPFKLGHLAILALKKLDYQIEYNEIYNSLNEDNKEYILYLEMALFDK